MSIELFRRERDGDAKDRRADVVLSENVPECLTFPPHFDYRTGKREAEASELQYAARSADPGRGELRHIRLCVAIQEIEDVMARRIYTCREGRPCYRRQCREGRTEPFVRTAFLEP